MEKMGFSARWWEGAFVSLSLLVSGCATLAKSQDNFAKRKGVHDGLFGEGIAIFSANMPIHLYIVWLLCLFVSSVVGHYIVYPYVKAVKKSLGVKDKPSSLALVLGCAERALYTEAFVLGWYAIIVLVFVLKAAKVVVNCVDLDTKKTGRIISASLLGNLLSLGVAILVGVIMNRLLVVFL